MTLGTTRVDISGNAYITGATPSSTTGTASKLYLATTCATSSWSAVAATDTGSSIITSPIGFVGGQVTSLRIGTTPRSRRSSSMT